MRVFICGPMTGYPSYNAPAFWEAAAAWEAEGYQALTPLDTDSTVWRRHYGRDFDPETDRCDYGDPLLGEMWVENMRAIASALEKPIRDAMTFGALDTETICQEADRLVSSDRQSTYGHPFDDFTKTAALWTALALDVLRPGAAFTPEHVALFMVGVKLSRLKQSPDHHDSMVDAIGYVKTYQLVRERRHRSA